MSKLEYNGYQIVALGTFPMVEIKAIGQGRVPDPLIGLFTTTSEARRAIDSYLSNKGKGKQNGKAKGRSTG